MHNLRRGAPGDLRALDQTSTANRERHRSLMQTDEAACRSVVVRWPGRYRWKRRAATLAIDQRSVLEGRLLAAFLC